MEAALLDIINNMESGNILKSVLSLCTVIATGFLASYLRVLVAKLNIEGLDKRAELGRRIAYDAVAYSSEVAARQAKTGGAVPNKAKTASVYMKKHLPGITDDAADDYVTSVLAKVIGEGATDGKKVAP